MKIIKRILLSFILIFALIGISAYIFLKRQAPQYDGTIKYDGLHEQVDVLFDDFGVPHIYANNNEDAYFALGYVHAQERLFQMELIRRLISGRLSEFLGDKLVKTDTYFKTLGLRKQAERLAKTHISEAKTNMQKEGLAYLKGINHFIETRPLPIEYTLLGLEAEPFTADDAFSTLIYMALGFADGYKFDMVMNQVNAKMGEEYLYDWYQNYTGYWDSILIKRDTASLSMVQPSFAPPMPIPIWTGSNGWVIAPSKTASGRAILANDTHIGFSQPSVWYEAHIEYPGFSFYGNYLAGVPFAAVGHNKDIAWGLTIFPMDITDIYKEKVNPENDNQVWDVDHWVDMKIQKETILVKGGDPVELSIKSTKHGPIINDIFENSGKDVAAFWWSLFDLPGDAITCFYDLGHAQNMDQARAAAAKNDILGLNILYADKDDNIAWWASGKIPKRPAHVNPVLFLDGASGKDELLGYYDFSFNPREENPARGFIVSANHEPVFKNIKIPGTYLPNNRFHRLSELLAQKKLWRLEDLKAFQGDVTTHTYEKMAHFFAQELSKDPINKSNQAALKILADWKGDYPRDGVAPIIFTKLTYHLAKNTIADEIGEKTFDEFVKSYMFFQGLNVFVYNESSPWWDDITTPEKETRHALLNKAFKQTMEELNQQLGTDMQKWHWQDVHSLTHVHAIGRKSPFDKIFNVGPFPIQGGGDTPNKQRFAFNGKGIYKVHGGAALRILLDFADVEHSLNINPTGQSGNIMSKHYKDQAQMYVDDQYRVQLMKREEIEKSGETLRFRNKN